MKFLPLTFRNLMRRPVRTILTFGATTVSFMLFGVLMILRLAFTMGVEVAGLDRLMLTNKMSIIQPLPISYLERIRAVDGVSLVTHSSWFGGIYQDPKNQVFQFAVEPETYLAMYPEFKLPPEQTQAWLADRQGAVVGKDLATRLGWKLGDKIPIQGTFNRPKGGDGITWEFNIVGIYDGDESVDKTQFLFRYDYLDENRRNAQGITGWYLIKVADPARSADVADRIDALFENSQFETKTDSEKAVMQSFANQVGDIGTIVTAISAVVLFIVLLIAASQMSLSIRERTREIGALKAMGFSNGLTLTLVLIESVTLSVLAGGVGLMFAWFVSQGGDPTNGLLPIFMLRTQDIVLGLALAALVGLLAGMLPAMDAMRLQIATALRRN